jgi:hypothetical protein
VALRALVIWVALLVVAVLNGGFVDYNVLRGRIWVLVLMATAVAPYVTARARGLLAGAAR